MYTGFTLWNALQGDKWESETTRTGPNDVSGVVWVLGEYFFSFFFLFFLLIVVLMYVYRLYSTEYTTGGCMRGVDDQNRPKRCWPRRLGLTWVFCFLLFIFFILIIVFMYVYRFYPTKYVTGRVKEGGNAVKGPNDARRVVWALGQCFLKLYSCFQY